MTVIPFVIWVLGTVTKGLVQGLEDLEIRGQEETQHYYDWPDESRRLEEIFCHLNSN